MTGHQGLHDGETRNDVTSRTRPNEYVVAVDLTI
jgi:hypothetical protein